MACTIRGVGGVLVTSASEMLLAFDRLDSDGLGTGGFIDAVATDAAETDAEIEPVIGTGVGVGIGAAEAVDVVVAVESLTKGRAMDRNAETNRFMMNVI